MSMQVFLADVLNILVQLSIPFVAIALAFLIKKAHGYIGVLKEKDKAHIIDMVTDRAAILAHAELGSGKAEHLLDTALHYASIFLTEHGITVSEDRLRADIQDGISKLPLSLGEAAYLHDYFPDYNFTTSIDGSTTIAHPPAPVAPEPVVVAEPVPAPITEPIVPAEPTQPASDVVPPKIQS